MQGSVLTTRTWMLLIATALLVAAGALNFGQRLQRVPPPTDGIDWALSADGAIVANAIAPRTAGSRATIQPGDRLVAISRTGREGTYEQVTAPEHVEIYLEAAGVGGELHYLIERPSYPEELRFSYADVVGLEPLHDWTLRGVYLHLVGVVFLFVGLFVLFKQGGRAPFALHFATLCVAAFVFLVYKPTGAYEDLDLAVAFLDDAAILLFAPLFFHFCAIYPVRRRLSENSRWPVLSLYAPALLLLALTASVYFSAQLNFSFSKESVNWLYSANLLHFLVALVGGAALLIYRFAQSTSIVVRQQLKWVVWGSVLAIAPFTLLYTAGLLFQSSSSSSTSAAIESWLMDVAVLPLVLIPLTFGNSVVRYRLMDVDVVVRRAVVYALTTLAISLMIGVVVLFVGYYVLMDVFGASNGSPSFASLPVIVAVVAMAVIVMTAAPLKNFLQERTNRLFYGERYDLRNGLLDFGRTLSATTALDPLLDALASRLQQVLSVERIAIFIEDSRASSGYRVARVIGLSNTLLVPPDFREMIRTRSAATGIVRADDLDLAPEATGFVRRALHYYVPCVVRGRMIAVIGLGRSAEGALLSSEDIEILRTVSGYVAVAIENSLLYQEQRERAAELEMLKEFNESIVESINIGLLAVDPEGRVMRCNSALEEMLGVERDDAVGKSVEELFSEDFPETLRQVLGGDGWQVGELRSLYQFHTATREGKSLVLNISFTPLQRADSLTVQQQGGALVVIEDTTDRTRLEEQLQQREKLSSIGLLAAGVAHEINTPLTGVSSYTQMLLGMIAESDPKNALLQKIRRQTERAAGIVNNLLNFSRMGVGGEFTPVDVNRVLDDTLQLLEPQLRQSRIELIREYEGGLPRAFGNAGKLQQVFTNLILNARDAIIDGGHITLRTVSEDESVRIEVTDTGIGIASEALARIYDPFFTTKGVGRGTGLGLAVTYGIVQEHGGRITAESAPGQGTTFRIVLPSFQERAVRMQAASD